VSAHERRRRATFCGRHPGDQAPAVRSFWSSESERQDFLGRCVPPPLEGWAPAATVGSIADPAFLERQANSIESEYRQWLRDADRRQQIIYFSRSV